MCVVCACFQAQRGQRAARLKMARERQLLHEERSEVSRVSDAARRLQHVLVNARSLPVAATPPVPGAAGPVASAALALVSRHYVGSNRRSLHSQLTRWSQDSGKRQEYLAEQSRFLAGLSLGVVGDRSANLSRDAISSGASGYTSSSSGASSGMGRSDRGAVGEMKSGAGAAAAVGKLAAPVAAASEGPSVTFDVADRSGVERSGATGLGVSMLSTALEYSASNASGASPSKIGPADG